MNASRAEAPPALAPLWVRPRVPREDRSSWGQARGPSHCRVPGTRRGGALHRFSGEAEEAQSTRADSPGTRLPAWNGGRAVPGTPSAQDPPSGLACSRGHRTHAPPSRPPGLQTEGAVGEASRRLGIQPDRHHGAPIPCLTVQPPETATISCPPAPRPPAPSSRQPPLRALQKHQQLEFDSSWCNQRAFRRVPRTSEHTRGGNAFQVDGKGPLFRPRASTKLTPAPEWPQSRARAITGRPRGCRIPASIRES